MRDTESKKFEDMDEDEQINSLRELLEQQEKLLEHVKLLEERLNLLEERLNLLVNFR